MPRRSVSMRLLQIDVPESLLEGFDRAVEKAGVFSSRAEAIRSLMQRFIENNR